MSELDQWIAGQRQSLYVQAPSSSEAGGELGYLAGPQPIEQSSELDRWIAGQRRSVGAAALNEPWDYARSATPAAPASEELDDWLLRERRRLHEPRGLRTAPLPRSYYADSQDPPYVRPQHRAGTTTYDIRELRYPPYQPSTAGRRRERGRFMRPLVAAGAALAAVALAATVAVGARGGHVEAHSAPSATAPASPSKGNVAPNGFKWRPILENGTLNMANAAYDAQYVPAGVTKDKGSIVEVINYSNAIFFGDSGEEWNEHACTGYVGKNAVGGTMVISAAHCFAGDSSSAPYPNYAVSTNINGVEHGDIVQDYRVDPSYDKSNDNIISPSVDMGMADVEPGWWWNDQGNLQQGPNGFSSLRPIPNATKKAPVGSLVWSWGFRPASGQELEPPKDPILQAMVVAGYINKGNTMVLIPVKPRPTGQQEGNSGSEELDQNGNAVATLYSGSLVPLTSAALKNLVRITVSGGDGTGINPEAVDVMFATVNSPANLRAVGNAALTYPDVPGSFPYSGKS